MIRQLIIFALLSLPLFRVMAQETVTDGTVYVQSLFTYPEAPDYMDDLGARADYLMDNFWNNMNFKQKVVNQNALQHAFEVYAAPMRWAQKAKVQNSIKNLLKKVEKNPSLATQLMKAAEETFHSPRSLVYIDEVYEQFLTGYVNNKKVKGDRKKKYEAQLAAMTATTPGQPMPDIAMTDTAGNVASPRLGSEYSIMVFGDSRDAFLRQMLLKLNTNMALERLCTGGNLGITFVNTAARTSESDAVLDALPAFVAGGYAPEAAGKVDLRISPSVYLIDNEGKIIDRNIDMERAFNEIAQRKFTTTQPTAQ